MQEAPSRSERDNAPVTRRLKSKLRGFTYAIGRLLYIGSLSTCGISAPSLMRKHILATSLLHQNTQLQRRTPGRFNGCRY
jgi:hypothetical protein